ncbi:hypothetical protein [Methanobrevibacter sp.]|uniref:hypothetical protein n=1 Tax=Methanobrevibacter sp. TaxID=66852 RepID=UPI0025E35CBA|nr:hypothetical protein [Methanobrevibacter sp.]MBQ2832366.1 hypothetical protein [Methanobrevibacter sp.]
MNGITDDSIMQLIETKIHDYEKTLHDIMNTAEPDRKLVMRYRNYLQCLMELENGLFLRNHTIFDTLIMNHKKHDTQFIFMNNSTYTVKKDDVCSFKDNWILIYDKDEFEKDKTCNPPVAKGINLDNVKLVETVLN